MNVDTTVLVMIVLIMSNLALWIGLFVDWQWTINVDNELDMIESDIQYFHKRDDQLTQRVRNAEQNKREIDEMYTSLRERLNVHILETINKK